MKAIFTVLLGSFLVLTACNKRSENCSNYFLAESTLSDSDEHRIIEAIMEDQYSNSAFYHVAQQTQWMADSQRFARYFTNATLSFDSEKIAEYIELNNQAYNWNPLMYSRNNLIAQEELDCLFESQANGWEAYFSKYRASEAILVFGRPVQDADRAIITYTYLCYSECSSGYTVTLFKIDDEWFVENHVVAWVS